MTSKNPPLIVIPMINDDFWILRLGVPTGILRGVSLLFKRFGPMILLTFSGGGTHPVISRMSLSIFIFRAQRYLRLWVALVGFMPIITGATLTLSLASLSAYWTAWKTATSNMRCSLWPSLVDSRPPQVPIAAMKALVGFFMPCT